MKSIAEKRGDAQSLAEDFKTLRFATQYCQIAYDTVTCFKISTSELVTLLTFTFNFQTSILPND